MDEDDNILAGRLPIKLDSTSNGEFLPVPLEPVHHHALELAHAAADRNARRLGLSRREFLLTSSGVASTLLAMNAAYAASGRTSGYFDLQPDAALDLAAADNALLSKELVIDVQGHYVNPAGKWVRHPKGRPSGFKGLDKAGCSLSQRPGDLSFLDCLGPAQFIKDVFMDSDTDIMVLTYPPSYRDAEPLTIEEASATAQVVANLKGSERLLLHGRVNPNQDGDLQGMDELASRWKISAWKTFTQWGPDGKGYFLSDDIGLRFIEKARRLGIKNICIHKGVPFGPDSYQHSLCDDIGVVAKRYPDVNFLVYHSGFVVGQAEHAYDPTHNEGIDSLIRSLQRQGIGHHSNVYAELGTTWRYLLRDPNSAAHAIGKLLKYIGPDNILWGTDSIWYGSPQDQIQAFRTFQIAAALREQNGYPELTPAVRRKIFGLNAMRVYGLDAKPTALSLADDALSRKKVDYSESPTPHFRTYGPKTRRAFLRLRARQLD